MTKILVIDNSHGITGAFKAIFHVANSLKNQFEFHFATPVGNKQLEYLIKENGFHYKKIQFVEISRSWSVLLYLPMLVINSWRLLRYLKRNNISIVHVNDLYNMTGVVIKTFRPSVALIYHVRLLSGSYAGLLYRFWIKTIGWAADQVIVVSECVRVEVLKFLDTQIVSRIYDFVELEEKWETNQQNGTLIKLFYPANYTRGKGQDYAIRSFRKILVQNDSVRITFSGTDFGLKKNRAYKLGILNEANDLVRNGYVTFTEGVTDIEKAIKEHHILLNFSELESFSMTCYEASYYGVPLIVTDCGGPTEYVEDGISGFVVPKMDIDAMSESILRLVNDSVRREKMGQQAKMSIRKRIVEENVTERYRAIYESFCKYARVTLMPVD